MSRVADRVEAARSLCLSATALNCCRRLTRFVASIEVIRVTAAVRASSPSSARRCGGGCAAIGMPGSPLPQARREAASRRRPGRDHVALADPAAAPGPSMFRPVDAELTGLPSGARSRPRESGLRDPAGADSASPPADIRHRPAGSPRAERAGRSRCRRRRSRPGGVR